MRAWVVLAVLVTACAPGADTPIDGLWYLDNGATVIIRDGTVSLESGEELATVERLSDDVLRYVEPSRADIPGQTVVLQVAFPTALRMTWTRLDGTPFRDLTRVADIE